MGDITEIEKQQASAWFRSLRDQIVSAFETLESAHATGPFAEAPIGQFDCVFHDKKFEVPWQSNGFLHPVQILFLVQIKLFTTLWV